MITFYFIFHSDALKIPFFFPVVPCIYHSYCVSEEYAIQEGELLWPRLGGSQDTDPEWLGQLQVIGSHYSTGRALSETLIILF